MIASGARSQAYQYLFNETSMDMVALADIFPTKEQDKVSEYVLDLDEQLKEVILAMVNTELTPRQMEVAVLRMQGWKQVEIAKHLNINQSTVVKTLSGTPCLLADGSKRTMGGIFHKLRKKILTSAQVLSICQEIAKELDDLQPSKETIQLGETFSEMVTGGANGS